MRGDKELELLVGKKERAFGALRQHAMEHKCQQIGLSLKETALSDSEDQLRAGRTDDGMRRSFS